MANDANQSADDALEEGREDEDLQVGKRSPLPEDGATPASPPQEGSKNMPPDHPVTDTEADSQEVYDEGRESATGIGT